MEVEVEVEVGVGVEGGVEGLAAVGDRVRIEVGTAAVDVTAAVGV